MSLSKSVLPGGTMRGLAGCAVLVLGTGLAWGQVAASPERGEPAPLLVARGGAPGSVAAAPGSVPAGALPDAPGIATSGAADSSSVRDSANVSDSASAGTEAPELAGGGFGGQHPVVKAAGRYDTVILPGQTAQRLSAHEKVVFGVRDALSPFSAVGWLASAGYEQITNGSPNYGQTGKGFAQRLGAASARASSETIFGESILAPIFHEDPRYYKQGSGRNFIYRLFYAGTRPIFTRTDGGRSTLNLQSLGGNLAGAALTQVYYPPLNRGFNETMKTFGGSVGGTAVGDVVNEFLADTLQVLHLKRAE